MLGLVSGNTPMAAVDPCDPRFPICQTSSRQRTRMTHSIQTRTTSAAVTRAHLPLHEASPAPGESGMSVPARFLAAPPAVSPESSELEWYRLHGLPLVLRHEVNRPLGRLLVQVTHERCNLIPGLALRDQRLTGIAPTVSTIGVMNDARVGARARRCALLQETQGQRHPGNRAWAARWPSLHAVQVPAHRLSARAGRRPPC